MTDTPMGDEDEDARAASIAGRAANGEGASHDDEPEPELFPMGSVDGDAKTIKTLIRGGLPVELTVSIGKAEVPGSGGLIDPDREGRVLVAYEVKKYEPIPIREGEPGAKRIVGWKIRQHLRAVYAERVDGTASEIEGGFAVLLSDDPNAAAALVDRLAERVSGVLATA